MNNNTASFTYPKDSTQPSQCEIKISNIIAEGFINGLKAFFELELLTAEISEVDTQIVIKFETTEEKLKGLQHTLCTFNPIRIKKISNNF
ncbi:MAG: hypothetical protein ACI9LN_001551 [Saprospiraceae bacterium]